MEGMVVERCAVYVSLMVQVCGERGAGKKKPTRLFLFGAIAIAIGIFISPCSPHSSIKIRYKLFLQHILSAFSRPAQANL